MDRNLVIIIAPNAQYVLRSSPGEKIEDIVEDCMKIEQNVDQEFQSSAVNIDLCGLMAA